MNDSVVQYFRCAESSVRLKLRGPLSQSSGYFKFGVGTTCYGKCAGHSPSASPEGTLHDTLTDATIDGGTVCLPFDLKQVVDNLRYELYSQEASSVADTMMARAYYLVRPLLSVSVRKHIQRWHFRDWDRLPFPNWPVDRTVDQMFEQTMLLS